MSLKLHVLLAKTDHGASVYKKNTVDYIGFFNGKQGAFKGEIKTYTPNPHTNDEPSKRGLVRIQTTVDEKLAYYEETQADYIDNLFAVEATNASGTAKVELKVGNTSFGVLSSLELLRLKTLLEGEIKSMYEVIPVRSDAEPWTSATHEMYQGRNGIFEQPKDSGVSKSIVKENYIMEDPNLKNLKDTSSYKAVLGTKDTLLELGNWTRQVFTGEWSHRQRAELLRRRSTLLAAVIEALKLCNEVEVVPSELKAKELFDYLHRG